MASCYLLQSVGIQEKYLDSKDQNSALRDTGQERYQGVILILQVCVEYPDGHNL